MVMSCNEVFNPPEAGYVLREGVILFSYRCAARRGIGLWLYVDSTNQQVMFAEKSWGSYRVLDVSDKSMTVKVTLNPGHGMNYHSHERRDEGCSILLEGLDNPIGDYLDLISSHSFF